MVIYGAETPEALELNRLTPVDSLKARLDVFEARSETASSEILDDLCAGTLRETAEMSDWLVI